MRTRLSCPVLLIAVLSLGGIAPAALASWTVTKLNLASTTERVNPLTATLTSTTASQTIEVSAGVDLTGVDEYFVSGDKLVVLGEAGRAEEVVIFDLLARRELDWFYCYYPMRLSDDWISYVEFYPSMRSETPTDVVLVYDLTKTPVENRLVKDPSEVIPAPDKRGPVHVGVPVYPERNASQRSYMNALRDSSAAERALAHTFVLLPPKRLIFVGAQGSDFSRAHDYLVVVDLSQGLANASYKTLPIPKDQLKRPGENIDFVQVSRAEMVSEKTVRLYVPRMQYGVDSILVDIP